MRNTNKNIVSKIKFTKWYFLCLLTSSWDYKLMFTQKQTNQKP